MNVSRYPFLLLLFSTITFGDGGHVGGGGDARRFRAEYARIEIWETFQDLLSLQSDPTTQSLCGDFKDPNASQLIASAPNLLYHLGRSKILWHDTPASKCLDLVVKDLGPGGTLQDLSFSYLSCPIPTPEGFYLERIFTVLQEIPGGPFPTTGAPIPTSTLSKAISYNHRCRELRNLPSRQPMKSRRLDASALSSPRATDETFEVGRRNALRLLENMALESMDLGARLFLTSNDSWNLKQLREEIRNAKFQYSAGSQRSCGSTELRSGAPISISLPECQDLQSELDVAWLIIHEASHHLGLELESYADYLGIEVIHSSTLKEL